MRPSYPLKVTFSCELCEHGIIEGVRRDNIPGVHLFRCTCSADHPGRPKWYPLWSEKFAQNFIPLKSKKHGQNRK